jgi:hypothetical protein
MNVIVLRSVHRHVSATHVAIFTVVRAIIQIHLQYVGTTSHLNIIQTV